MENNTSNTNLLNEKTVKFSTSGKLEPFVEHRGVLTYYPGSNSVYFYRRLRQPAVPNDILYRGKMFRSYVLKTGQISLNARISKTDNLGDAYIAMRNELDAFFEILRKSI